MREPAARVDEPMPKRRSPASASTLAAVWLAVLSLVGGCGRSGPLYPDGGGPAGALCLSDGDCMAGFFCERPDGMCDALTGSCQGALLTADCAGGPAVCGCDGKTYNGDCLRQKAGVSKAHNGQCP
jgi:Prokaryotic lipoprotein-attachment site